MSISKLSRWREFTTEEIYMLRRQAIESSFEIVMVHDYTTEQIQMHADLLNELGDELKRRDRQEEIKEGLLTKVLIMTNSTDEGYISRAELESVRLQYVDKLNKHNLAVGIAGLGQGVEFGVHTIKSLLTSEEVPWGHLYLHRDLLSEDVAQLLSHQVGSAGFVSAFGSFRNLR